MNQNKPIEIYEFLKQVFEIYDIRARVGEENGIIFVVHSNEQNHSLPHIHARYNQHEVSISILTGEVLAGNIPQKNLKLAQKWIISHREKLLRDWCTLAISAPSYFTKSNLDTSF